MSYRRLSLGIFEVLKGLSARLLVQETHILGSVQELQQILVRLDTAYPVVKAFSMALSERVERTRPWSDPEPVKSFAQMVSEVLSTLVGESAPLRWAESGPTAMMVVGPDELAAVRLAWHAQESHGRSPLIVVPRVCRKGNDGAKFEKLIATCRIPIIHRGPRPDVRQTVHDAMTTCSRLSADFVIVDATGALTGTLQELRDLRDAFEASEMLVALEGKMTVRSGLACAEVLSAELSATGFILAGDTGKNCGALLLSLRTLTGVPVKLTGAVSAESGALSTREILGRACCVDKSPYNPAPTTREIRQLRKLGTRIREGDLNLEDFLAQMQWVKSLGPIQDIIASLPGFNSNPALRDLKVDEGRFARFEAAIRAMTLDERRHPDLIDSSRKVRIAEGSGTSAQLVDQLFRQFALLKKMMREYRLPAD